MATSITSAFMAKLLGPIPVDEEQADTKQFRRLLASDISTEWGKGMRRLEVAKARHLIAWAAFKSSGERYVTDHTPCALALQAAIACRRATEHHQCLILAPRATDMRWKKRLAGDWSKTPSDIAAAIARDEARFAEGQ